MPTSPVRVLVIDDSSEIVALLVQLLAKENCRVATATSGAEGLRLFESFAPQILLCGIVLPDANGMDICRQVRQSDPYCQVLMLSALKEEFDKVLGLELGADDYVTKPFSSRELRSRMRSAIRRLEFFGSRPPRLRGGSPAAIPDQIEIGKLRISLPSRQVWINGSPIELTRKEFELLVLLSTHQGRVFSREDLRERLWRNNPDINERSVDAQVRRLRGKLEPNPEKPFYVETLRGSGYRFRPAELS